MLLLVIMILLFVSGYISILTRKSGRSYSYLKVKCKRNNLPVSFTYFCFFIITDKGLLALLIYRLSNKINSKVVGKVLTRAGEFLTGIEIYYNADIGKSVEIWHGNGVVIGQSAVVGNNCIILQQVTIGGGFVKIGQYCKLGAGAKVLGNIELGDDVVVAANAVVITSVTSGTFVGGVPALKIKDIKSSAEILFGTQVGRNK